MSDRDYNKDIQIDENDLENEWIEHPSIVLYYNEAFSDAQYNRDKLKIKLDQTSAKLDSAVRKDWAKYGFESKPTETALRNYILLHPDYRKDELEHLKSVREVTLLTGVRSSFEHRKKALENIVSLRISGFHSEPRNKEKKIHDNKEAHTVQKKSLNARARSRKLKTRKKE